MISPSKKSERENNCEFRTNLPYDCRVIERFIRGEQAYLVSLVLTCLSKNALAKLLKLTLTASASAYLLMRSITSGFKISSLLDALQR